MKEREARNIEKEGRKAEIKKIGEETRKYGRLEGGGEKNE